MLDKSLKIRYDKNMEKVAKFEKVSEEQFVEGYLDCFHASKENALEAYRAIKLPCRATSGSAGYDFFSTAKIILEPGKTAKIPTGIRARIRDGWVLALFPRSGLGFRYRLQLNNTVGIIDSDYYQSDNEGHIFVKITNDGREGKTLEIPLGGGFAQGIFFPFGITEDDESFGVRNGGFGSTGK